MAYTDDAVKAKLSALNETQEGIVTVAQWIMFHRRHADRTAQMWTQRLSESTSSKRLNLIYLANEVIQQSKARKKHEFVQAFSPIIAEATGTAYKGATNDIRQKIRRVIEVWRARTIFEPAIQDAIEAKVDELDKAQGSTRKQGLGGSLFSSAGAAVPSELQPLVTLQGALAKAESSSKPALTNADAEFDKLTNPSGPVPTPPVHAARLSSLLKTLATAEGAVSASIKARQALIKGLEKLIEMNNAALASEEARQTEVQQRRVQIETKKREVEDNIMRGLNAENPPEPIGIEEVRRPKYESITPPPVESLTPTGTPPPMPFFGDSNGAGQHSQQSDAGAAPDALAAGQTRPISAVGGEDPNAASAKKRRIGSGDWKEEEIAGLGDGDAMDGIDADVAQMLQ